MTQNNMLLLRANGTELMNIKTELPADVIAAIQAKRKVTAIKLLRAQHGIGLKEAKGLVDAYVLEHPSSSNSSARQPADGLNGLIKVIIGVAVICVLYTYFS